MNRKLVSVMTLIIVLMSMLGVALKVQRVEASGTIYIRGDGSVYPSTANITSTDNVTYTFTDNIGNMIVVERSNIIIDGNGYTLWGIGIDNGFTLNSVINVTIKNTNIEGFERGLHLQSASNNTIYGNNVTNNEYGIFLFDYSNYNTIYGNNITNNNFWSITLSRSSNNTIYGNNITNNGRGIVLSNYSNYNSVYGNNVTNNEYGIFLYDSSSYNSVYGNNITNGDYGIYFYDATNYNSVYGNNVTNNEYGVWLQYSSNNLLYDNLFGGNKYGFYVTGYKLSQYLHSIDTSNLVDGKPVYYLINQQNLTINPSSHPEIGFLALINSTNITVEDQTLTSKGQGLLLANTNNSRITNNNIKNNDEGIVLNYYSSNNVIYHNNLINNTLQVYIPSWASGYANFWDSGVEGNYWSDYNGADSDHDGIGDIQYEIDSNNIDHYPLMGVFHSFSTSLGYHVNVISNSTIEDFTFFESNSTIKMYVSNMTTHQIFGFCRVCVPYTLMNPEEISVNINDGQTPLLYHNYTLHDNGTHRWIYFAYPHSTHKIVIQEDTTPPVITIVSPENKTYTSTSVSLNFTVNEPTSWIGYSLDGAANVTITGNTILTDLHDGSHYVVVYANDTVGNMGMSSTVYFAVDRTPLNITSVSQIPLENNVQPEDEVKVNATVTDYISGVKQVTLIYAYTNSSGTWIKVVDMTNLEGNVWNATIPAFPYCTNVTYVIVAENNLNNTITTEEMGYDTQYHVIPEFPSFIIMPLFMIATLLAVIAYRRKHTM